MENELSCEVIAVLNGEEKKTTLTKGMTIRELLNETFGEDRRTVAAKVDGHLRELSWMLYDCERVEFVDVSTAVGFDLYKRSLVLLMLKAAKDVISKEEDEYRIEITYTIGRAYFCQLIADDFTINDEFLAAVKKRMQEIVEEDVKIQKKIRSTSEMAEEFRKRNLPGKAKLLKYRLASRINIYSLGGYEDYFYGYMVPSAGYLTLFDIEAYDDGFILRIPNRKTMTMDEKYDAPDKLYRVLRDSEDWGRKMGITCVGELNDIIVEGGSNNLLLLQESLMEKKIAEIANQIVEEDKKLILIAGPSSSGKTTFSNRLSVQLIGQGFRPHPIAMDNFFKERSETPLDENGNYDFECVEAVDMDLFNDVMTRLLDGEEVKMPTFNFMLGKKEYQGDTLKLEQGDILVVEGIHALNPISSEKLPNSDIFKIYISALTQLNVDEHNRISTSDTRLLRRIVRDARTRGHSVTRTIGMWESVRRGEEKYIFPFQEEADVMFNSAIIYELPAIKQFVVPLLFSVPEDSDEYFEARRLLKFLDYILGIDVSSVPQNSLMREFIGGGCFKV